MTATTAPTGWCPKCARPARIVAESLDARHPVVVCQWRDRQGKAHGHGRLVGMTDQAEAEGYALELRLARLVAAHERKAHHEHVNRDCPTCQAEAGHPRHRALRMFVSDCAECIASMEATGSASSAWAPAPR